MNKVKNNKLKQSEKEKYEVNIMFQGNKTMKELLKEILMQSIKID